MRKRHIIVDCSRLEDLGKVNIIYCLKDKRTGEFLYEVPENRELVKVIREVTIFGKKEELFLEREHLVRLNEDFSIYYWNKISKKVAKKVSELESEIKQLKLENAKLKEKIRTLIIGGRGKKNGSR